MCLGCKDGNLRVLHENLTKISESQEKYLQHSKEVISMVFLEKGQLIASGSLDLMVILWKIGENM